MPASSEDAPKRHVTMLGLGFFGLFAAYTTSEILQTTINGNSGYICLFTVYGCLSLSSIFSPWLVLSLGPRFLMPISAISYVVMTASFLFPGNDIFLTVSCALVGISAATLWNSNACYVAACATELSKRSGKAHTDCTSLLNARFYAIFPLSGSTSSLISAAVLYFIPGSVGPLFIVLTLVGTMGVIILCILPRPDSDARVDLTLTNFIPGRYQKDLGSPGGGLRDAKVPLASLDVVCDGDAALAKGPDGYGPVASSHCSDAELVKSTQPPSTSPLYMIKFLTGNKKMLLMIMIFIAAGAKSGFFVGAFMQRIVIRALGTPAVGFISGLYGGLRVVSMLVWSPIVQRKSVGRRTAFVIAIVVEVLWCAALAVWSLMRPDFNVDVAPVLTSPPPMLDWFCIILSVVIIGFIDPVFDGFGRATLQSLFKDSAEDLACSMSAITMFISIGFCGQSLISLNMNGDLQAQLGIVACLFVIGGASLLFMHRSVASIDPAADDAVCKTNTPQDETQRDAECI